MTIGIDCRFASTQSGLGRYTRELVRHLVQRNDRVKYVLFVNRQDPCTWLPSPLPAHCKKVKVSFKHYSLAEQILFPWKLLRLNLFFAPHFNVPLFCPVPFVATIHDLILHRYPNQASKLKRKAYLKVMQHTVRSAKSLIAVSRFTASELTKQYGTVAKNKLRVVHEAPSPEFHRKAAATSAPVLKKYGLKKPFFLYVGNAKEHKNVQMLIDAYQSLDSTETELVLVTGGKEADALKLCDGVRILRDVPEADLCGLYFFTVCFVTASLYEGFGLSVIEAAACGSPVIITDCGALPEIAPMGARIVEPTVESIADALREPPPPSDPGKLKTWDEVAAETFEVLR